MSKNDVFPNPAGDGLLMDIQTKLLSDLNTRVVVPLLPKARAPKPTTRLNPVFDINGDPVVMVTLFLAAVPVGILKAQVCNMKDQLEKITTAVEMLMQGF